MTEAVIIALLAFAFAVLVAGVAFGLWMLRLYRADHVAFTRVVLAHNEWMTQMVGAAFDTLAREHVAPPGGQAASAEPTPSRTFDLEREALEEEARKAHVDSQSTVATVPGALQGFGPGAGGPRSSDAEPLRSLIADILAGRREADGERPDIAAILCGLGGARGGVVERGA